MEQAEIESRLIDLVGIAGIQNALHDTRIDGSEPMAVEAPRLISAKQRALAQFVRISFILLHYPILFVSRRHERGTIRLEAVYLLRRQHG
jgi:hypothetical protein